MVLKQEFKHKIVFVGAHGTGKTTLVNRLRSELEGRNLDCTVTPEVPRIMCEAENDSHFFRRGNNSLTKQISLLFGQTVYEDAAVRKGTQIVLCDRSILDHWAYTKFLFAGELARSETINSLSNFIAMHCQSYDRMFYVPIEFAPEDDGTREDDAKFQQEIDQTIRGELEKLGLAYITIAGTIEERANLVLSVLGIN